MFIEHVNLTVTSLDRSIAFYQDLFGWSTRWRGTTTDGRPAAHVGDERCYIAFFESHDGGRAPMDSHSVGFNHCGFVVDRLDDMKRRLAELGIEHGDEHDYDPGRRIYFIDPDGIEIELVEYAG